MWQASQNVRPGVAEGVLLPAGDVGVLVLAARLSVATEGEEVIAGGSVLPGALVEVGPAPRIEGDGFLQVRSAPVERQGLSRGLGLQRVEALVSRGIEAVDQHVDIERRRTWHVLRARRRALLARTGV